MGHYVQEVLFMFDGMSKPTFLVAALVSGPVLQSIGCHLTFRWNTSRRLSNKCLLDVLSMFAQW